jgi:hypothetical protein
MKTYKQLKDELFEEVGKIDISQLGLGFNGLSSYVELLERMSKLPDMAIDELMLHSTLQKAFCLETPKTEKE